MTTNYLTGYQSPEQNLSNLMNIYNARTDGAASNYSAGQMDYSGDVPTWVGGTTPTGGYNWNGLRDMYNPNGMFDQQWLGQFDQYASNPTYTNMYGAAPTGGTEQDKIDWMNLLNFGGTTEANRQTTVAENAKTDMTESALMAAAMAGTGALAYSGAGLLSGANGILGSMGGVGDLAGGLSSADVAAGMVPEFGTHAGYAAGMGAGGASTGGSMFDFGGYDFGGFSPDAGFEQGLFDSGGFTDADFGLADGLDVNVPGSGTGPGGITGPDFSGSGSSILDIIKSAFGGTPGSNSVLQKLLQGLAPTNQQSGGVDWSRLFTGGLGAILNQNQQNKMMDQFGSFANDIKGNQFPHRDFQRLAYDHADPNKRFQSLMDSPMYRAADAYAQKAQARRNAQTGDIDSGYGDTVMADVIGKNAGAWDQQNFGQIKDMSGMGFNNADALSRLAMFLPTMFGNQNKINMDIGTTIGSSGILPWLIGGIGGLFKD